MKSLVSVIIPCYNAEQWISEAIDSILAQTYSSIEVIVIDDGSTDRSLEIIKSYGDRIRWETGSNRGQSAARNRGFALSQGKYIQWLDADDYILSEKIEAQVAYLESVNCDIVYGDWRYQSYKTNQEFLMGDVKISGKQPDVLESLLAGWWVASMAYLMRRETVEIISGWDVNLRVQDDPDFWIRAAIAGASFQYQSGCYSVYRRYGATTVSTSSREQWCHYSKLVLEKAEALLMQQEALSESYKKALAKFHFRLARNYFDIDKKSYYGQMRKVKDLDLFFRPSERFIYNACVNLFGFSISEHFASKKRKIKNFLLGAELYKN